MMNRPKPIPCASLFFLVVLFTLVPSFKLGSCMVENHIIHNNIRCPETEKQALLSFKQSLEDPFGLLSSWNNRSSEVNCCSWKGVDCNNFTGHVQQLHLRNNFDDPSVFLSGKISHSLLNLTQLRYLDLSGNNFTGRIPSFLGSSLRSLRYLNLSNTEFHGAVPHSIGNLSNLRTLDLGRSSGEETNSLYADSVEWLSGLSKLKHLSMNSVDLSKVGANWAPVINSLPSLVELRLLACNLNFSTDNVMNEVNVSSSLSFLHLSNYYIIFAPPPRWIFQLDNLIFLDLSGNNFEGPIPIISNTTKLQHIDLSFNHFNSTIPDWLYSCKHLHFVDLSGNYFEGPIPTISNTTKLQHIDLSDNNFNSTIPDWLYSCKDLHFLDLSLNSLHGTISRAIANLSSLNTLRLRANELSGNIPREIASLCKLQILDLPDNKLQGELFDSFGNMPDCFLDTLQELNLGSNQLSGHITDEFGEFKSLQILDLSSNLLSGAIPPNLGQLMSIEQLYISHNKLSGNIPECLGQLLNLKYLYIDNNKLGGVVTESHFANLTKLEDLDASNNHQLNLKVNANWTPPFHLWSLQLISLNLGTKSIPSWLETQKHLDVLDLSSTGISGVVPNWIWGISFLNLSHNHLHGEIPNQFDNSSSVFLSSNQFSGPLPRMGNEMQDLDLSDNSFSGGLSHFLCDNITNLEFLHLGGNQLTGELPDCFLNLPSLRWLDLGNNNLSGSIPNSMGFLTHLTSLNLYRNNFSGQIPFSVRNCTNLVKIDLHENNLNGDIPTWIGMSLTQLVVLILRSNKLSGEMSSDLCRLKSLRILDVSNNDIFGIIPSCVNNFTAMITDPYDIDLSYLYILESATLYTKGQEHPYDTILPLFTAINLANNNLSGDIPKEMTSLVELRSLNLSANHFTGLIPKDIGDMKQLESLDLSRNSLSGKIPDSLATMTSLEYLNLSYNNLTGKIPPGPQISGFELPSFMGNHLCGPQIKRDCDDDGDRVPEPGNNGDNQGEKSEIDWFYVFLSSGFATGFSVVCSTLILKKSWRDAILGLWRPYGTSSTYFSMSIGECGYNDDQPLKAVFPLLCLI